MANLGWDVGNLYFTNVLPGQERVDSRAIVEGNFYDFIQNFRFGNNYIYRDQLRQNLMIKQYLLDVDVGHLIGYNETLAQDLKNRPADLLPLFESAVKKSACKILYPNAPEREKLLPDCEVTLKSETNRVMIRDLDASYISKLVRVPGIVISASTLTSRATHVHIMCRTCGNSKVLPVAGGFSGIQLPRVCDSEPPEGERNDCGLDPYMIMHDKCKFVDQQTLKLQEAPDEVPVGELPRHMLLSVDRYLTNKVVPGTRTTVMGIYSIFQHKSMKTQGAVAIRSPYIRVIGLQIDVDGAGRGRRTFTEEEEEEFIQMARMPNLYQTFSNSIAPSIFGNSDIKKAIACLLFSGSKKVLPDKMKLRGDINVLLLGDPGTAKSQLLKFVEKVAPIAVYTSGKGSSAAGLTASVVRDPGTREFYLEGGAMVLADGGVVCIDEFDKMRDEDRVAIHEAMEQQTISIAKAGITTILNSRTSVLAAANPIFGRYDEMKSAGENIDFQTTILSRFDMIFIVRDEHNEQRDNIIAKHVMNVHMNRAAPEQATGEIDLDKMRSYISYCRTKCAPRLSAEAADKLSSHFVGIRSEMRGLEMDMKQRSSIPITLRQLEAIIRISESLAKMTLSPVASEEHVDEAIRLFKYSTMDAVRSGQVDGMSLGEVQNQVTQIETDIRRRLPVGSSISERRLTDDFVKQGFTGSAVSKAILIMVRQEILQYRNQRNTLYRASV